MAVRFVKKKKELVMARLILILYVFRSYDIFCFSRLFAMSQIKKKKKTEN